MAVLHYPIPGREAAGSFAEQLHARGGLAVTGLDLACPKCGVQADSARQCHLGLEPLALLKGDILAPQYLFNSLGAIKENHRKLADHERLAAQFVDFRFDIALHDSHCCHYNNDREDPNEY